MARRRYQRGRVFLRKGKIPVWVGRWREDVIGTDGVATRIHKSVKLGTLSELKTKRLAQRRLDVILARINGPDYRPVRVATVAEFSERWKLEVLAHRKPSTIRAAKSHLRAYIVPMLGKFNLDEIGRERQQAFLTRLSADCSRKTVVNVLGTLAGVLNTARSWGYIAEPVKLSALTLPTEPLKVAARFFSAAEARAIIAAAVDPYKTMFAVAALTGLRAGELLGLQLDDLDFEHRLIFVRRSAWCGKIQTVKSKASRAPVPMPEVLAAFLKNYLTRWKPNPDSLLFVNRMGRPYNATKVVQRGLWPVLDGLKIKRCGLHSFRHTHTSLLLDAGAAPTVAQAQLRHSDARITLGIYGHVVGDSQRNTVEKVAQVLCLDVPALEGSGEWIQ